VFKDVAGYEGLYAVNEMGEVWSYEKISPVGLNGGLVKRGGHLLKPMRASRRTTHQRVILTKDGKRKQHLIHRLVAQAFILNPDNMPFINHKDCNPENNHVLNLEWCTAQQNSIHAYQNGRWTPPNQQGAKNANSKLTEKDVIEIRKLHGEVKNCAEIARRFFVNPKTINMIVRGTRWQNVKEHPHGITF
jgi:hypothetical protein